MSSRAVAVRRGLRLEYLTIAWNLLEALVGIISGILAGSIALISFGLDSLIEVSSSGVLLWRLHSDRDPAYRERAEYRALRLVGISFFALTIYVAVEALRTLWEHEDPHASVPGIVLAAAALIVMPLLARAKRRVASSLRSGALHADSRQADICAYLAAITLAGLLLNAGLKWWWADPVAALAMSPFVAKEGVQAWQGKTCCEADSRSAIGKLEAGR